MHFFQKPHSIRYQVSLLAALAIGLFATISTQATAQTFEVNGSGILTGVDGVVVDGSNYNVTFVAGSCISVFNGCTSNSDFTFGESGAYDASSALVSILSGGYVNSAFPSGIVDGASQSDNILTPYGISCSQVCVFNAVVEPSSSFGPAAYSVPSSSIIYSDGSATAYAVWSVPEPWTIMLFGAGLLGLGFIYRRRNVKITSA